MQYITVGHDTESLTKITFVTKIKDSVAILLNVLIVDLKSLELDK